MIHAEQVTPGWLTDRFRKNGYLSKGLVRDVQIGKEFESTAAFLTPLKLTYSGDAEIDIHPNIIFKRYREDWFRGGLAESVFYRDIATRIEKPPTVTCYDFDSDSEKRQCYFLFEDASATHYTEPPKGEAFTIELYREIIDAILKFHVGWWDAQELLGENFLRSSAGPLRMIHASTPEVLRDYCRSWKEEEFPRFASQFSAALTHEASVLILKALESWERLYLDRICKKNGLTLLHGDLHRHNIFYPKDPERNTLYFSDWETYKRGLATYDLCYLLADEEPARRRTIEKDLLRYYYDGLLRGGVSTYDWDSCVYDYRLSVIANIFPTLVWKRFPIFENRMQQFLDWNCRELLS